MRDGDEDPVLHVRNVRLENVEFTAMDWAIVPQALRDQLVDISQRYPTGPLYITENGAAYDDEPPTTENGQRRVHDPERLNYYALHLAACRQAMDDSAPLKGYFAWSLMDNFEWAFGYTKRFGIVYVDFTTQQRTIKDSGRWYRDVIAANAAK